jgi:endonuclease YncB( thermonuclease family)
MFLTGALVLACTITVIDGDTIRCGGERIRLTGIDAPELSRCPTGRQYVKGDGQAAKHALANRLDRGEITIRRFGQDRYGRTLAAVYVDGVNAACAMLAGGHAEYVAQWDEGQRVARDCGI